MSIFSDTVKCEICGKELQQLSVHLKKAHDVTVEQYRNMYPGAPTISKSASRAISDSQKKRFKVGDNGDVTVALANINKVASQDEQEVNDTAKDILTGRKLKIGKAILEVKETDESTQSFVPEHDPNYEVQESLFEYLAAGIAQGDNIMLWGMPGSGKSSAALELACVVNQPLRKINMNGDVRISDFVGEKEINVDPGTQQAIVVWKDGILPRSVFQCITPRL